jgi:hypothetical protein
MKKGGNLAGVSFSSFAFFLSRLFLPIMKTSGAGAGALFCSTIVIESVFLIPEINFPYRPLGRGRAREFILALNLFFLFSFVY